MGENRPRPLPSWDQTANKLAGSANALTEDLAKGLI
jgi:hypothetical protein